MHRKVVTILFCDVVGSTALGETTDPEALRELLARYFERMKQIVERHGGTVEKFIGDAVMAVFGVPVAHEDDALRACRAALEMRESFTELGVEGRVGVTTGEVVTGSEERLATGDAVNVAARLQQAAHAGEVLIGEPTLQLLREAADVETLEPLALKGKAQPVATYRLLAVHEAERRHDARFVGRERELAAIRETWERALTEQHCELLTIVGEAGVGKSRLVAEALAALEAPAVHGRCLPYGEGITYWPVLEVIKQLEALPSDPAADAAIRSLVGESSAGTSGEEIAWAFRKLLEEQAPLVVIFDDIQWGEQTFLDLVEHVALLSSGAPLLLVCMARPELVERRSWPVALRLEPLPEDAVDELIPKRAPAKLRQQIVRAAGGNPLFVGEILAMAAQAGGQVTVPPTLRALLETRLDQLEPPERQVLERGAVEGEVFHRGAVHELSPEEDGVTPRLAALVRKEFVRPTTAQLPGEDGFRFGHLLIRDAAYDAIPKATRAELHERFAAWLDGRAGEQASYEEIIGYHLERAHREALALGKADPTRARRAGLLLAEAGRQAFARADASATSNLLRRACELLPRDDPVRLGVMRRASTALWWSGDVEEARRLLGEQIALAVELGEFAEEWSGRLDLAAGDLVTGRTDADSLLAIADKAIASFDESDNAGLASVWRRRAYAHTVKGLYGNAANESERALRCARAGRERFEEGRIVDLLCTSLLYGPAPADEAVERCEAILLEVRDNEVMKANVAASLLGLLAMRGSFDAARERARFAERVYLEFGLQLAFVGLTQVAGCMELLAGDPVAAEHMLLRGLEILGPDGPGYQEALLADAVFRQGRYNDAALHADTARRNAPADNVLAQVGWRGVRAKLDSSEPLAREAVALGERTDALNLQGDTLCDLAEMLQSAGRGEEAAATLEQALERYQRKHNVVMAERVCARLAELRPSTAPAEPV